MEKKKEGRREERSMKDRKKEEMEAREGERGEEMKARSVRKAGSPRRHEPRESISG